MTEPADQRPLVLVQCEWSRDRDLISHLLHELGVDGHQAESVEGGEQALLEDRVDLILADTSGGFGPLIALFDLLDRRPEGADVPMVLLAHTDEVTQLGELAARRFNAVLLTKPMGREQLAAAVESGLRLRARQQEVRGLLAQVSASNDDLASANLALEQRREEAAEEARRKTRFLAAISHDIRTPVNALVLSCELLRAITQASPAHSIDVRDIAELTGALLNNAASLVELVNDLLDIARHDQGKFEFEETDFPIGEFLSTTIEGLRPLAEQKRLRLDLNIDAPAAIIRTDRVKLARVLQNLVANAIKFTDVGYVRVVVRVSTSAGLHLEVVDTGVGIPTASRVGIFDEFAQLRNPERDRTKGTGLGLAICRRLVVGMGGLIEVTTRPDQIGSTFLVTLPPARVVVDGPVTPGPDSTRTPRVTHHHRGEVLIVEDHEPSRILLQRLLRNSGLSVRTAPDGAVALQEIERSRPDLVLMDLMMPVMGGLEVLRRLRAQPQTNQLNVIILTGDLGNRDEDPIRAVEGATACLSKPVEVPLLLELLDRFLPSATTIEPL